MKDTSLDHLRKKIDELDAQLLEILSKRLEVVREVGRIKKEKGIPPLDEKRWQSVLKNILAKAKKQNIPEGLIENIYNKIHEFALDIEAKIK
jgi:chorismate mutase